MQSSFARLQIECFRRRTYRRTKEARKDLLDHIEVLCNQKRRYEPRRRAVSGPVRTQEAVGLAVFTKLGEFHGKTSGRVTPVRSP